MGLKKTLPPAVAHLPQAPEIHDTAQYLPPTKVALVVTSRRLNVMNDRRVRGFRQSVALMVVACVTGGRHHAVDADG